MNCLLARRLIERGVRFVQLFHEGWDHHSEVYNGVKEQTGKTDQASAALVTDLKRRGLLEDTLVIWGGEFGRTPMVETNPVRAESLVAIIIRRRSAFGLPVAASSQASRLGKLTNSVFNVVKDKVTVHDLHATILRLLGFEHTKLTYRFQGRDFRLTDVFGELVPKLVA
jgi:hypothetical protein